MKLSKEGLLKIKTIMINLKRSSKEDDVEINFKEHNLAIFKTAIETLDDNPIWETSKNKEVRAWLIDSYSLCGEFNGTNDEGISLYDALIVICEKALIEKTSISMNKDLPRSKSKGISF